MSQKPSIFQEVDAAGPADAKPQGGMISRRQSGAKRAIRFWLLLLALLVAVMIAVGGLTRLTDSGLSITEWKPVTGALPPLGEAAWNVEFDKYKATPEYQLQNKGMSMAEFKVIFWWEWGHRQLGRVIGLVWAIGFFGFLAARKIPKGWTGRLLGLGVLGGAQGAVGWWMVSSGLTGRMVDVASYRLAIHLGLAFVIIGLIAWYRLLLNRRPDDLLQARRRREGALASMMGVLVVLVAAQVLLGALVAGIDAGRGYIDWPMMNGEFLPSESFDYEPFWSNFFENPALVQFNHRMLGYLVLLFTAYAWWRSRSSALRKTRRVFNWVAGLVVFQMLLGILTVLYAAPWQVAILHQIGAIIVVIAVLRARFAALYPAAQSLR
ncbi:MAG: COX15/CtaA family protein [Rhodobacteraceae bacterium]|nr:COX15/CtaA family protein [Paracoccaceae bacterium]